MPWVTAAFAAASLASVGLQQAGIAGPWLPVALGSGACALASAIATALQSRAQAHLQAGIQARAAMAESERDGLQRDLQRHDRLEQELLRAKQAAESAAMAKGEFLATMSHEIRTPMSSIVGFTEVLLKREDLPEPARRQLALIDRAGASLLTVVNDILDFSKVEAGEVELSPTPISPRSVAQDAMAIVAEAARRKGLDLQLGFIGPVEAPVEPT